MARGRPAVRRQQTLEYVRSIVDRDGIAPSYGMICNDLGIGTRTEVHRIVKRLEQEGALRRAGSGRVRRIRLKSTIAG